MKIIGRKQTSKQSDWLYVYNNIDKIISEDHIKRLENEAIEWITQTVIGTKYFYGWSAGKDSLVLEPILKKAGISGGVCFVTQLEYNDYIEYIERNIPDDVKLVVVPFDMEWLAENPHYLFPECGKLHTQFFSMVQRDHLNKYFYDGNYDQMILGHRRQDGNHTPCRLYETSKGLKKNNAIMHWTQEEVIAYLHYNNINLPNIYFYPDGFKQGTGAWNKMMRSKERPIEKCWEYVFNQEPPIVIEAAKYFESAGRFLDSVKG